LDGGWIKTGYSTQFGATNNEHSLQGLQLGTPLGKPAGWGKGWQTLPIKEKGIPIPKI